MRNLYLCLACLVLTSCGGTENALTKAVNSSLTAV